MIQLRTDIRGVESEAWIWLFRIVGALAGSAISLAYFLPHGTRDAFLRLVVGFTSGMVFGAPVGHRLGHFLDVHDDISLIELNLLGAALASLAAWWALGLLKRFLRKPFEDGSDK